MTLNPQNDDNAGYIDESIVGVEGAYVTETQPHDAGDDVDHAVEVVPETFSGPTVAEILVDLRGDVCVPTEGDWVLVAYRTNGRPVVLGTRYGDNDNIPEFEPGERVVGHPETDSYVRLANDGSILVEADDGTTIECTSDGDIVLNEGQTAPIVDITTTTDSDGHVTSIDVTRADGVFVPSN
jgi:hypothetical protein